MKLISASKIRKTLLYKYNHLNQFLVTDSPIFLPDGQPQFLQFLCKWLQKCHCLLFNSGIWSI